MKNLSLPVEDYIADSYDSASKKEKMRINSAIGLLLARILGNRDRENNELFELMDQMSEEAAKNGLTIEKLGELMEWDDETMRNLFGKDYLSNA